MYFSLKRVFSDFHTEWKYFYLNSWNLEFCFKLNLILILIIHSFFLQHMSLLTLFKFCVVSLQNVRRLNQTLHFSDHLLPKQGKTQKIKSKSCDALRFLQYLMEIFAHVKATGPEQMSKFHAMAFHKLWTMVYGSVVPSKVK